MHPVKLSLHYVDMVRTKHGKHNTARSRQYCVSHRLLQYHDDDDYNDDDESINNFVDCTVIHKGPVVQKADNAIHWKKFDSGDNPIGFAYTYPLDRDLSGG